jgi:hypothetical protein
MDANAPDPRYITKYPIWEQREAASPVHALYLSSDKCDLCIVKYQKYIDILHNSELAREKDKPRDILKIRRSCKIERFFETFELCYPRFNDMTEFLEQYSCVRPHRSQDLLTPPEVYYSCPVQNVSVSRSFCCERKGLSSSARGSRILFVTRCPRAQFRSKLFRRSAAGPNSDESRFSSPR